MRHYTNEVKPSKAKQKPLTREERLALAISAMSNTLLMQMRYYDSFTPYECWKPKDIYFLSKAAFNTALQMAYNEYNKEGTSLFELKPNKVEIEIEQKIEQHD